MWLFRPRSDKLFRCFRIACSGVFAGKHLCLAGKHFSRKSRHCRSEKEKSTEKSCARKNESFNDHSDIDSARLVHLTLEYGCTRVRPRAVAHACSSAVVCLLENAFGAADNDKGA